MPSGEHVRVSEPSTVPTPPHEVAPARPAARRAQERSYEGEPGWGAPKPHEQEASSRPGPGRPAPEPVQIRLSPELHSVGQARAHLVRLAQQWSCPDELVQDARVVVSELLSNGVLHARTELQVLISPLRGGGLRVEVHDASSLPVLPPMEFAEAGASLLDEPPPADLGQAAWASPPATGRGLSMVAALASAWGWFPDSGGGKVVWAELGTSATGQAGRERAYTERSPYPVRPVRLIALPLRLLKGSEDHFDDLFRELQMAQLAEGTRARAHSGTEPGAPDEGPELVAINLAGLAENIKARLAAVREPVRRAIWEAARRGDRLIDLDLLADAGMPSVFEEAEGLLAQAARAARLGLLLTEPPSGEIVAWRRWLRQEMEDQIAGKPPRACPFPVAPLHEEDSGPTSERLDAARRDALAELRATLRRVASAGAHGAPGAPGSAGDRLVTAGLEQIITYLGARRSTLCMLAEDNETVTIGATVDFTPAVMEYWQTFSLSADLPASEAIRTAKPLFFRTFAELDERYPIFLSTPSESDPSLACLPLMREGAAMGCLVVSFAHARDFSPGDQSFLKQLTGEISDFIVEQRRHEMLRLAAERNRSMDKARVAVHGANDEISVLRELVQAIVGFLADNAAAHKVEENGTVRYVTNAHRDPERAALAARLLQKRPVRDNGDDMVSECVRTGRVAVLQRLSEEALVAAADDDEDLELLRRLAPGSVCVLPVRAGGRLAAVVTMGNDVGRFISDEDLDAAQRLVDAAGEALARLGPGI